VAITSLVVFFFSCGVQHFERSQAENIKSKGFEKAYFRSHVTAIERVNEARVGRDGKTAPSKLQPES
jgi:hypothetical protein